MKRIATTKADEIPEFVEFWSAWKRFARHTDGRGDARDTFLQHVKFGVDARDILDGARYFLRTMKDKDREYIPLAASWINKRAYEDLAELERAYQAKYGASQENVVQMQPTREQYLAAELRRAERSFR